MFHCQYLVSHFICLIVTTLIGICPTIFSITPQSFKSKYLKLTIRLIPKIIFLNHLFLVLKTRSISIKIESIDPIYFDQIRQSMCPIH